MKLTRNSRPLYAEIARILKDRILHGVYPVNTNIPSEPQLEQEFQVSKITVRNAIKTLVQEGYLETGSGKGTRVIRNTSFSKLSKLKRFTEVLVEEGYRIHKQLLHAEIIDTAQDEQLQQLFGNSCLLIQRLYYLNDQPYIHYTHYLTHRVAGIESLQIDVQSLYELIEDQQVELNKYRDGFSVVAVVPETVLEALKLPQGMPLLCRTRHSYGTSGELVEYSVGYYNTEYHQYVVNYDV